MKLLIVFLFTVSSYTPFCDGWEAGYKAGWCYDVERQQPDPLCYDPYVPYCPYAKPNETTYEHGYNRGFLTAINNKSNIVPYD